MLKSTHKAQALPPLPEGWTEHKAPTGHSYYYNTATKQSTYTRPVAVIPPVVHQVPAVPINPSQSFLQYQSVGGPIPSAGATFDGNFPQHGHNQGRGGFQHNRGGRGGRDGHHDRRPQPTDKPKSKQAIPGCEPWILVHTKLGRRFAYNPDKNQSYWRIPEKLNAGILALDQERIRLKAEALTKKDEPEGDERSAPGAAPMPVTVERSPIEDKHPDEGNESSEYEEVEVTDDEDDDENPSKRQRTEGDENVADDPIEFNEDDIAYQLAAMGQEYGLDQGEYDDGHMEDWEEGVEGLALSDEDAMALFKDLLNDFGINPYSPWEKLVEEGKLVDDSRYTALTSMKARKEVWEDWSREKIRALREQRAKEERKDPRIPFLTFLQQKATPKLYWPEFKRKFKKESEMRDTSLSDKDREKFYREHISRLKLPQSTLKSDLSALLKSQPISQLNNSTLPSHLPPTVLADIRFISLDPAVRDPLVEAFIANLPPPPETIPEEETEEGIKQKAEKERRQKALDERERKVAEEKRRQEKNLRFGKSRLREEEAEIERAMRVGKAGLKSHLMPDAPDALPEEKPST